MHEFVVRVLGLLNGPRLSNVGSNEYRETMRDRNKEIQREIKGERERS
jgi:hypothetical protein